MPKANDTDIYKYDLSISLMDYLFGSDADNGKKNKSYRIKDIIQLINGVNGKNNLQYLYSDGNNPDLTYYSPGIFFTDTNEADPLAFTQLIVNKSSLQPIDLTTLFQRLGELEDVVIKLDNPSDPNNFFNFKVVSIEDHVEYFIFEVELFKDFYSGEFLNETIYSVYFDIKSATESDDLKLDKGGYEGTAQDLSNSINNISFPDDVLKTGEIVITGLNAFVSSGDFQWRLNQVDYLTAPAFSEDIEPTTEGFKRTDILEGDNAGIIHLKKGVESESASPEPSVTAGRIRLAGIPVSGSTVGDIDTEILGKDFVDRFSPQRIKGLKTFEDTVRFRGDATDSYTDITDDKFTFYKNRSDEDGGGSVSITAKSDVVGEFSQELQAKGGIIALVGDSYLKEESDDLLDAKLDISAYNQHYKGTFLTEAALNAAHPTANVGDYAQVNEAGGTDVVNYSWDAEENIWVAGGGTGGAANTDALPEGSSNLYFTTARVLATLLTGISFATGGAIVSTDSVLVAFGKLQKQLTDGFTTSNIKLLLGITTLSGSNTGDETTASLKTKIDEVLPYACSDETSNLTTGVKITFRMPYAFTLSGVSASLNEAPTISSLIVDIKEGGVSILSTLLSVDASEKTSVTAATPAVISDVNLAYDAEISISITQIGSGNSGKGLKVSLIGKKA